MDKRKLDNPIDIVKKSGGQSYWCKWCGRHIQPEKSLKHGLLYIHDDVYHSADYDFKPGDEHRLY